LVIQAGFTLEINISSTLRVYGTVYTPENSEAVFFGFIVSSVFCFVFTIAVFCRVMALFGFLGFLHSLS